HTERLSKKRRTNPKIAGENGEGRPTVGSFSNRKLSRPESASASMSFSETSNMTSWPRSRSTSATAMPGKRCPPVPPHAITAFIRVFFFFAEQWEVGASLFVFIFGVSSVGACSRFFCGVVKKCPVKKYSEKTRSKTYGRRDSNRRN